MFSSFKQLTILAILGVAVFISAASSAPASQDDSQPPLIPSYGDQPPKINSRDFWSDPQKDEPQEDEPAPAPSAGSEDNASDETENDDNTNEVQDSPAQDNEEEPSSPRHVIVKRNKRPIRYNRNKNNRNNQQVIEEQ